MVDELTGNPEDGFWIPLSQGLWTVIDSEDYDKIKAVSLNWFAHKSRKRWYATAKVNGKTVKMHRVIMDCEPGDGLEVDHVNLDGLDNRKQNLKVVTPTENKQNKGMYDNNKSGTSGVYYAVTQRGRKFWHAQITTNGKQRLIGRFLTKEEAVVARKEAENAERPNR